MGARLPGLASLLAVVPGLSEAWGDDRVHETRWTQPALVALQLALAAWWAERGVTPTRVLGHSLGEVAAWACAGALEPEQAVRLAARRGELMACLPERGAMSVIFAPADRVREALVPGVEIAALNGPEATVISGSEAAVAAVEQILDVEHRRPRIDQSSHCTLVEPMLDAWEAACADCAWQDARVPVVSNVTGQDRTRAPDGPYWRAHLRGPVRFADGIATLHAARVEVFLELGPHPVLVRLARPMTRGTFLPSLHRERPDALLRALATLWCLGADQGA